MESLALGLWTITVLVWWVTLIPITLINGYKYYKLRHHIIMTKRYSQITIYEVLIMIIKLIWGIFLFLMMALYGEGALFTVLFQIPYQLLSFMLLYCWVWRFWLIHYDTNFTLFNMKQDWAIIINKRYKDFQSNWYIQNKSTYGNYHWFKNHCILPLVISQTLIISVPVIYFAFIRSPNIHNQSAYNIWHALQLFGSANMCFPFILLLLIYLKTPHFQDQFFVSAELKKIFIILLVKNILTFTIFVYQIVRHPPPKMDMICFFFLLNISNIGQWFAILIATYYVNKMVAPIIDKQQYKLMNYHTISSRRHSASIPYLRITSSNRQLNEIKHNYNTLRVENLKLLHVVQYIQGFEAFIVHLSYEFCSECLLSFVEILQYQQCVAFYMHQKAIHIDHIKGVNDHSIGAINSNYNKSLFEQIKLPQQLPKSSIVYDGMDEYSATIYIDTAEFTNMMKIKAYKLFAKYIAVGSQYQVNISYCTRRRIEKLVKEYDPFLLNEDTTLNDLLFVFDKTIEEIYSLMNDSFNRFRSTPEFNKLQQLCSSSAV